jgi:hypothetical protein
MPKFLKSIVSCATFILLNIGALSNASATTWSFSSSGTIDSGIDVTGIFGNSGTDLANLYYSQRITLDPSLYDAYQYSDIYGSNGYGSLPSTALATDTVTVNGISVTFTWDTSNFNYGQSSVYSYLTQGIQDVDYAYQYQYGYQASGSYVESNSFVYSYANAFNIGPGFDQFWAYYVQPNDNAHSSFFVSGNNEYAYFNATPTKFSISVPEPQTYTLLLAGLAMMYLALYLRKKLAPGKRQNGKHDI